MDPSATHDPALPSFGLRGDPAIDSLATWIRTSATVALVAIALLVLWLA